ncbi:MAG TPA: hypothetical protein PK163_00455 [Steroidobacteraceae bacterium]|nr:hypothetical protein [Steroidobacteraceae bacterium]
MSATGEPIAGSTWKKLRRRKVVQWGLGYVAVAWGIVQAVAFAVGTFHWPELLTRVAAVMAAAGLPLTVVLAWFHGDRGQQRVTRGELAAIVVILGLGTFAVMREAREVKVANGSSERTAADHASAKLDRHRVAILPFDNLGSLAANAAFVGGVHDTLITQVAKIPGLSVISRSSVLQFAGKHPTIRDVANALGVGTVLEGSVEREGNRLRIQAQLIDAGTDTHVWAETYDRTSDDLFAVQSEIAKAVAEQLRIRLTGDQGRRLLTPLSSNPEAYEHYVIAREHASRFEWAAAVPELITATTLDPHFAAAYAYLSMARTWQKFVEPKSHKDNLPLALDAANKALELDPTLPEGHLAMAVYLYRGAPDIDRAAAEFERAIAGLPNDATAFQNFGFLRRWQGRWEDASALFARAAQLDPKGTNPFNYPMTLVILGHRDDAAKAFAAAIAAQPHDVNLALTRGWLPWVFSCDLATTERAFRDVASRFPESPDLLQAQTYLALATGDTAGAIGDLARLPSAPDTSNFEASFVRALAYRDAGRRKDSDAVLRAFLQAASAEIRGMPDADVHSDTLAWMAAYHAMLGDRSAAQDYVRRAIATLPPVGDASNRTDTHYFASIALAWAGDPKGALAQLEQVLGSPSWQKPAYLWCDPYLAPLRKYPPFRQALAQRGADTSIDPLRRETWPKPSGR